MAQDITKKRRRVSALFALTLVVASVFLVRWIVTTKRPPGAMTVIEAQAMDMTTMKAPEGVQPVAAEAAMEMELAGVEEFPGTVVAWNDEEVVARIPGRVVRMPVYPGDKVRAGQLLAQLEADEFAAQAAEGAGKARAAGLNVTVAEAEVQRLMAARSRASAEAEAAELAVRRAQAELESSGAAVTQAQKSLDAAKARLGEAEANLRYLRAAAQRERQLYEKGASSLDEVQLAESRADQAAQTVEAIRAEIVAKEQDVARARAQREAAMASVEETRRKAQAAAEAVREAERAVQKAKATVEAAKAERSASQSGAATTRIISGYRELRALDNAVVTERLVSPGTLVQPGQTLMRLKVIDRVRIQFDLPERLLESVRVSTPVRVGGRNVKVTSVFGAVDPETRTFRCEAAVENPDHSLLPGQFVTVTVQTAPAGKRLAVRQEAIQEAPDGGYYVWVVEEVQVSGRVDYTCTMHPNVHEPEPGDCPICKMPLVPSQQLGSHRAKRKTVKMGPTDGRYTAAEGISAGEQVIYRGFEGLSDGLPVEIVPWDQAGPKELPKPPGGGDSMEGMGHAGH